MKTEETSLETTYLDYNETNHNETPKESSTDSIPKKKKFFGDRILWAIYVALILFSIVEVYSASSTLAYQGNNMHGPFLKHLFFTGLATGVIFLTLKLPRRTLPLFLLLYPLSVIFVYMAAAVGERVNNAARWINIPGTSIGFQPSELAKVSLIFLTAYLLKKRPDDKLDMRFYILTALSALLILPIIRDNLSTGLIMICFVMGLGWIAMGFKKPILIVGGSMLLGALLTGGIFMLLPKETQVELFPRSETWVNRYKTAKDKNDVIHLSPEQIDSLKYNLNGQEDFQSNHAKAAIARGFPFGVIPGNSMQRDILPQAYSDFIYAIIIEEMGIFGGLLIPLLYIFLFFRLSILAHRCRSSFHSFLLMGFGLMYVMQAVINMSVAAGVLPVTGQPLPLVSRGGTSLLLTGFAYGILIAISKYIQEDEYKRSLATNTSANSSDDTHDEEVALHEGEATYTETDVELQETNVHTVTTPHTTDEERERIHYNQEE